MSPKKRILVIGASDHIGETGLEIDQKVIAAHGCDSTTVRTVSIAMSKRDGFVGFNAPGAFVKTAIHGCFEGGRVEVFKIGSLASEANLDMVLNAVRQYGPKFVIIDEAPKFTRDLPHDALRRVQTALLQLTTILTLGIPAAMKLLQNAGFYHPDIRNLHELVHLAKELHGLGSQYVLLKGDHLPLHENLEAPRGELDKQMVVDVFYDGKDVRLHGATCITTGGPQGDRYALASAIASNLALGDTVPVAIHKAHRYVGAGIIKGDGLIDYFHSTYTLPFSPGCFLDYLLNREDVRPVWDAHIHHDFVKRIGDGTLPIEKFKVYLVQDYLSLVQLARAKALSAYKFTSMEDIAAGAKEVLHIQRQMSLHLSYCAGFGLSKKDVEGQEEHQACTAYTRYVLDISHSESWFALQIAFAPCLLGYGIIAKRLWGDPATDKDQGNRYWKWMNHYMSSDYRGASEAGAGAYFKPNAVLVPLTLMHGRLAALLEKHAVLQSPSQVESLVKIFVHATKMVTRFWDVGNE